MNYNNRIKMMELGIKTLKEMALCMKHQKIKWTIDRSNIILGLTCDVIEGVRK